MKNTPIPKNTEYMKKLIGQMEKIVKTMRWKALFFLKEKNEKYKTQFRWMLVLFFHFLDDRVKYGTSLQFHDQAISVIPIIDGFTKT